MTLPNRITINDVEYVRADSVSTRNPFEVYPHDLPEVMTYLDAEKAVAKMGDGWRIPTLEELQLMYKNKDETFCTAAIASDYPGWYWSSTEPRDYSSSVHIVCFSDGGESWDFKAGDRLSCRPVRLVAAPSLGAYCVRNVGDK